MIAILQQIIAYTAGSFHHFVVPLSRFGSFTLGLRYHTVVSFTTLAPLRYLSEEGFE